MQLKPSRRGILAGGSLALWVFAAGCGSSDKPEKSQPPPRSENITDITNRFPSDLGVVPRDRGVEVIDCGRMGGKFPCADLPSLPNPPTDDPDPQTPPVDEDPTEAATTLVLYDSTGPYAWLGELYAILAANLSSHFGTWSAKPVIDYQAGDGDPYQAIIYVGSTWEEPLPTAFLDDVLRAKTPVVWMYNNIWQLAERADDFAGTYGFDPATYDLSPISEVVYKGVTLERYADQGSGVMSYSVVDTGRAEVLATAVRSDETSLPWALRANNLTYIGEIPFAYMMSNDRYIAFSDMLFDILAPETEERHRALLRLEDVSPNDNPDTLRAIADYLASKDVPFSIAVIPVYTDPRGVFNDGVPVTKRLSETPEMMDALRYMVDRGGRIIMHGYTHQYSNVDNPYNGVSADDTEFYLMHVDELDYVIYDGPIPEESPAWVNARINAAFEEFESAGLGRPKMFEYPHYAGSHLNSMTIRESFDTVYHRGLYFGGTLLGGEPNYDHIIGQFFPYVVKDIYGWKVLPENLGNFEPEAMNHHAARFAEDLVHTARVNRVVRDGFASFFYHPYYGLPTLTQIVEGVLAEGYTFVAPEDL